MGRYDTAVRCAQIRNLVEENQYLKAMEAIEDMDFEAVPTISDLYLFADVFLKAEKMNVAKELYYIAYRRTASRPALYRLLMLIIRMGDIEEARELYLTYEIVAGITLDTYELRYRLAKAAGEPRTKLIEILEHLKKDEYTEEWGFQLARLYEQEGMREKCVKECEDLKVWFGTGKIVEKAEKLRKDCLSPSWKKPVTDEIPDPEKPDLEEPAPKKRPRFAYAPAQVEDIPITMTAAEPKPLVMPEVERKIEPEPQTESEPLVMPEIERKMEPQTEPEPLVMPEIERKIEPEPQMEPEPEPLVMPEIEQKFERELEPELEPLVMPEIGRKFEPEPDLESFMEPEDELKFELDPDLLVKSDEELKFELDSELLVKPGDELGFEPELSQEPDMEPDKEPEAEPETEPEREPNERQDEDEPESAAEKQQGTGFLKKLVNYFKIDLDMFDEEVPAEQRNEDPEGPEQVLSVNEDMLSVQKEASSVQEVMSSVQEEASSVQEEMSSVHEEVSPVREKETVTPRKQRGGMNELDAGIEAAATLNHPIESLEERLQEIEGQREEILSLEEPVDTGRKKRTLSRKAKVEEPPKAEVEEVSIKSHPLGISALAEDIVEDVSRNGIRYNTLKGVIYKIHQEEGMIHFALTGGTAGMSLAVAKKLFKELRKVNYFEARNIGKIAADKLDTINLEEWAEKFIGGCMYIMEAPSLSNQSVKNLSALIEKYGRQIVIILEGSYDEMDSFLNYHKEFEKQITFKVKL